MVNHMKKLLLVIVCLGLIGCEAWFEGVNKPTTQAKKSKPNICYLCFTDEQVNNARKKCDVNGGVLSYKPTVIIDLGIMEVKCNNGAVFTAPF